MRLSVGVWDIIAAGCVLCENEFSVAVAVAVVIAVIVVLVVVDQVVKEQPVV